MELPENGAYILVLTDSGRAWTWGDNRSGQLGLGDLLAHDGWRPVQNLDDVAAIAGGAPLCRFEARRHLVDVGRQP